jgi:ParB family chromosome partitioning protein
MDQSQERLLGLLAFCAACTVNAVQGKGDRFAHAHPLAQTLDLDMAAWSTPTAGNFFGRLTKTGIVDALRHAKGNAIAPAWLKAKKADLARRIKSESSPPPARRIKSESVSSRMVKKLIFGSEEGKFARPKAHAASRS